MPAFTRRHDVEDEYFRGRNLKPMSNKEDPSNNPTNSDSEEAGDQGQGQAQPQSGRGGGATLRFEELPDVVKQQHSPRSYLVADYNRTKNVLIAAIIIAILTLIGAIVATYYAFKAGIRRTAKHTVAVVIGWVLFVVSSSVAFFAAVAYRAKGGIMEAFNWVTGAGVKEGPKAPDPGPRPNDL